MCELFGLSASRVIDGPALPLAAFRARGGGGADNPDGWGLAWREGDMFRLEKAPEAGCRSADFERAIASLQTNLLIGHVRKAKYPPVNTLANTHPFRHACCGRTWAFAHNGLVPEVVAMETDSRQQVCHPDGETDSEFAFCHLLGHVTRHFREPGAVWLDALSQVSGMIARHGKFNFLLSDGEHLIAYGHDRLHYLESSDHGANQALIATEPLSDAPWTPFDADEMRIYRAGVRIRRSLPSVHESGAA
jgi:glutamine amidotransferase